MLEQLDRSVRWCISCWRTHNRILEEVLVVETAIEQAILRVGAPSVGVLARVHLKLDCGFMKVSLMGLLLCSQHVPVILNERVLDRLKAIEIVRRRMIVHAEDLVLDKPRLLSHTVAVLELVRRRVIRPHHHTHSFFFLFFLLAEFKVHGQPAQRRHVVELSTMVAGSTVFNHDFRSTISGCWVFLGERATNLNDRQTVGSILMVVLINGRFLHRLCHSLLVMLFLEDRAEKRPSRPQLDLVVLVQRLVVVCSLVWRTLRRPECLLAFSIQCRARKALMRLIVLVVFLHYHGAVYIFKIFLEARIVKAFHVGHVRVENQRRKAVLAV